ncbi:MAG TPA: PorV/PorQ family protein [Saprospiraceae bacterium]|nr:PorV/PorQ family protein [Saprospiraceae bacterium]HMQ81829.1 PorV/PorQ family protein [Saprospiraceae bacterium]
MMKRQLLFCFLSVIGYLGHSQKYSNEFLSIGVGARAQALGNAVVASVDDVTAGVWNPAGLANLSDFNGLQLGAMHAEWFGGVGKFDYLGLTLPMANKQRRLGISLVRFGIDEIPNTLSLYESDGSINYDNIVEFSAADYAFLLSYAQRLNTQKGRLQLGGNVKVVHRRIGPFANSWGFGIDLGLQYQSESGWQFGVLGKDITTTFNAWSFDFTDSEKEVLALTNNEIPINSVEITKPQLILGIGKVFQMGQIGLHPELNLTTTTDGQRNTLISADPFSIDPALGLEVDYSQFLFLRVGASQFQREKDFDDQEVLTFRPSIGLGLKIASIYIDYGFTDLGSEENTFSHIISLKLDIKAKTKAGE